MKSGVRFFLYSIPAFSAMLVSQIHAFAQEVIQLPESFQGSGLEQIVLPGIHNNPIVPTDTTGPGGSLGLSKGLREQLEGPEVRDAVIDVRAVRPDERYTFIGRWSPLGTQQVATVLRSSAIGPTGQTLVATRPVVNEYAAYYESGTVETVVPVASDIFFMPTVGGRYKRISENEVMLESGATLVKADEGSVLVSGMAGSKKVLAKINPGTLAMISVMDNRMSVVNLISRNDEGCIAYVPQNGGPDAEVKVWQGTQTEIHPQDASGPTGQLTAAGRPPLHNVLSDGTTIRILRLDYTKAMKTYGLRRALPAEDFDRLLKVAAANTIVLRTRPGV